MDAEGQNGDSLRRADRVCVKGLALLANISDKGDKTQIIAAALLKLVTKGIPFYWWFDLLVSLICRHW